jgi:hypothetical protein
LPFSRIEHVGAWRQPFWQTALLQSAATIHTFPVPHSGHEPPQSASLSVPFLTLSVQVAA